MGPALVATMVQGGIRGPSSEKLHPFFVKGTRNVPSGDRNPGHGRYVAAETVPDSGDERRRSKRRKTESSLPRDGPEAKNPRQRTKYGGVGNVSLDGGIVGHLARPEPKPSDAEQITPTQLVNGAPMLPRSDEVTVKVNQPLGSEALAESSSADAFRPQATPLKSDKVLKYNPATGTLGSPPKPKQKRRPLMMVCIRYGRDEQTRKAIGDKVTQILDGKLHIPSTLPKTRDGRASAESNDSPVNQGHVPKNMHPFFIGKGRPPPSEQSEPMAVAKKSPASKHSVFMSTPVSPKKPTNPFAPSHLTDLTQFGIKSSGTKIPGAMHSMWPAAGMSHVRGEDVRSGNPERSLPEGKPWRKSKGHVMTVTPQESILSSLVGRMNLDIVRNASPQDEDSFMPAPPELRLPRRRFESGRKLQKWIIPQLETSFLAALTSIDDSSQDELSVDLPSKIHPAIIRHYHSLETQLSAYDKSSCESLTWTQKYAPTTAAQVLQVGKETALLKGWLEALKVQAVETGGHGGGDKGKVKSEGPSKKRKRKAKPGEFVVDSDDESSEMDTLSDTEHENLAGLRLIKRSVIRSRDAVSKNSKDQVRLNNTIVISGPHGCGKTAAVYAVAKELDFEVFEINSSSRRSGKDILEKVGDMTRNHLVQQDRTQTTLAGSEDDEVSKDMKLGKQGMMTAFFRPQTAKKRKQRAGKKPKENADKQSKTSAPKSRKQSLILLEEADVLYEEDKQFWTTLMGMMVQSRRPFVVTCNDESLLPIQSMSLHGIFRFSPPPPSLAVDLCLLVAANEGHALGRTAVESLYRSRGNDLRATLSELNYWCQIGVGDRKGGFDWFYSRWPKGSDVDDSGDVVRVISEDTYLQGMGWIGRNVIGTTWEPLAVEEEAMHQAWDSWQLDMGDWYGSLDMETPARAVSCSSTPSVARARALAAYEEFCGAMSEADICSWGVFGTALQENIDPTLPELPSSVRDDFIVGRTLLEADPATLWTCPGAAMSISLKSSAREALEGSAAGLSKNAGSAALEAVDERKATCVLDTWFRTHGSPLTRRDIGRAFDPIAISPKAQSTAHLEPSVFDRPTTLIVLDVAPWVRSIVSFEHRLMQERLKLSNLLSAGGRKKRMRTTRSAYSALEGGERRRTRKERYFGSCLITEAVMQTGADSFQDAAAEERRESEIRC